VNVFLADEQDDPLEVEPLRRLVRSVLLREGVPDRSDVTVMFVGNDQMAEYNRRFLDREGPTDVLAFPLVNLHPGSYPEPGAADPPLNIGDVVIAPEFVRHQAEELGVSFDDELALMVVHGLLHLLGYDHMTDEDAEAMEAKERRLLKRGRKT
jgi:probable rRNA maturation factor